jgi:hypothetical protein
MSLDWGNIKAVLWSVALVAGLMVLVDRRSQISEPPPVIHPQLGSYSDPIPQPPAGSVHYAPDGLPDYVDITHLVMGVTNILQVTLTIHGAPWNMVQVVLPPGFKEIRSADLPASDRLFEYTAPRTGTFDFRFKFEWPASKRIEFARKGVSIGVS